jgi:hypothetical protein
VSLNQRRRRDERGAVAIVAALASFALFGVAALAVDLGNAFARARDVQAQADFAAIAAGRVLPAEPEYLGSHDGIAYANLPSTSAAKAAIDIVATYLNANQPIDDGADSDDTGVRCDRGEIGRCIDPADLFDNDVANGEVIFTDDGDRLRVITPSALVSFGLANVLGVRSTRVTRTASVMIGSPGRTLPFYIGDSCSSGTQAIQDPAPGRNEAYTPTLVPASSDAYRFNQLAIADGTSNGTYTSETEPYDGESLVMSLQSNEGFAGVTEVGFTRDATDGGNHETIESTFFAISDETITFTVPTVVHSTPGVWYIRVATLDGVIELWSSTGNKPHPALVIGAPGLECAGEQSGNFGSLRLSRNDTNSTSLDLPMNIALGIQHGLESFPSGPTPCDDSAGIAAGAVLDPGSPTDGIVVNCLMTDPGLVSAATRGMITGTNGYPGLLAAPGNDSTHAHSTSCNLSGTTSNRLVNFTGKGSWYINDDALTCFFTNDSVSVGQVSPDDPATTPVPAHVISADLFTSPRFFWIPVISYDAAHGHSTGYPILRFQAAFLSGQVDSATRTNPNPGGYASPNNGVIVDKNSLEQLFVVLIDSRALPEIAVVPGGILPYVGTGTKVVRLID